ncbi:hypothetical protein HYW29_00045 [Candidatus Amesbacteria bacterium]|nr:hypothetical protein [Candidatus Amesbacteria bacterium]
MLLAQGTPIGNFSGIGPLGEVPQGSTPITDTLVKFASTISTIIGVATISAGLWFMVQVFIGAFQWLTSGGDKQALENAKKRLTHAVIGLLMVVLSYALISVIGLIFGIDILNISGLIAGLHP